MLNKIINLSTKRNTKFSKYGTLILLMVIGLNTFGSDNPLPPKPLTDGHYVVLGTFRVVDNARGYVSYVNNLGLGVRASYGLLVKNEMHYVYAQKFENIDDARLVRNRLRQMTAFPEAWVLQVAIQAQSSIEPTVQSVVQPIVSPEPVIKQSITKETVSNIPQTHVTDTDPVANEMPKAQPKAKPIPAGKFRIYVNTINSATRKEVVGPMEVIDAKRAKVITAFDSHSLAEVSDPKNGSSEIIISSKIFGYKREHHVISLKEPVNSETKSFTQVEGDTIIVNYELQRHKKGDIFTMFNVIFYKDAAIMRPESKFEINSLLSMLQENSALNIRIHGHTNGNSAGNLISMGEDATNYFSLAPTDKQKTSSAKKLSYERAFTIQHYLVANGISKERMEVSGWGGKKMIYDKHESLAKNNVRVEIEIL